MKIGIIGAMHEEVIELKEIMRIEKEEKLGNLTFFCGELKGKDIVLVECGIGKVNGAICATLMAKYFNVDKVLFTGVAGGLNPDVNIGDIVISTDAIEHDFDTTAFGDPMGIIPRMDTSTFIADKELIEVAVSAGNAIFGEEKIWKGRVLSGDIFVADGEKINWLREFFNGECVEMEGAAVAHVCHVFQKPFLIIRSISDKANSEANVVFSEFVKLAAANSKKLIEGILERL
ncbi:MAG: 5'-methylthioadenosine/adenosylhomocysteine nucleosidase [Cetobacterium sp.]|nr:5'-methylthioadenosine/adenosylhomocysteine nucleosidase [Cetobacterium sp.]